MFRPLLQEKVRGGDLPVRRDSRNLVPLSPLISLNRRRERMVCFSADVSGSDAVSNDPITPRPL